MKLTNRLSDLFRKTPEPEPDDLPPPLAPIQPDIPIAVIGDVHGCVSQLERLLPKIPDGWVILCVGDVIDRGEHSREAVELLLSRPDITVIQGNHEAMMLDFLSNPLERGRAWLRHGGLQTLASYNIGGVTLNSRGPRLVEAADALRAAIGPKALQWFSDMPALRWTGNVAVVHAGADPAAPINEQPQSQFIWGHAEFEQTRRADGIWVVHGHTIVPEPYAAEGRIAVDTGAYATGRLTAGLISPDGVRFVHS
ncbi:MAG: metallophosphoesterase [Paracoccaceae bacterium]